MKYKVEYTPPTLTVDAVIFQLIDGALNVLLIERPNEPFKGAWALPGGYSAKGETTLSSLERIVIAKAGVSLARDLNYTEQLYTFDTVARDPRGHAVSVTYMGCGYNFTPASSAAHTQFFPVTDLPQLAYDHQHIINYALERLQAKLTYTNTVFALLPTQFTLTQLQGAYEAILLRQLDKRNFRKKFQSLGLITETGSFKKSGAHRPAMLYKFKTPGLEVLARSFD